MPVDLHSEVCIASTYSEGFNHPLASGVRRRADDILVAHRHLPFHTVVRVTRLDTGKSLEARVEDRGPFVRGRCIDLSRGAARQLGFSGVVRVRVDVVYEHQEHTSDGTHPEKPKTERSR